MSAVGKIVYKILGDNSDLANKLDKVGDMAEKAVASVAKIGAAAMGAAATGIGILSKKAIECYSEYEQLTGGVETLFKDSADIVMQYADNAYKAAGMSANAYMETVTSFSASLLQGLDGDTAKAAEIANQAIVDMSDNANKMGTSMDMIQNAYQGFAKQNYTMLDNLKIGYGGTQAEMARLINDSGVLGDSMTVTAQTVNNVSFDKIIEAIHVIQTNMGITGTTAKEASTTIQGSISAMSAAWENFMTGVADPSQDFDKLTSNLIDSVLTVADNLIPRIMAVLPQMATGLEELAGNLLPLIPETLEKMLPDVLAGANNLISALLDTLSSIAETAIPIVSENAEEIIDTLLTGMLDSLPAIATSAVDLCSALIEAILDNADIITQGAFDVLIALANGISQNSDILIDSAIEAIFVIADTLIDNIDAIIDAAALLITSLGTALIEHIPDLILKTPEIVIGIAGGIIGSSHEIVHAAEVLIQEIGDILIGYDWVNEGGIVVKNIDESLSQAVAGGIAAVMEATGTDLDDYTHEIVDYSNMTRESIEHWITTSEAKLDELDRVWGNFQINGNMGNVPEWIRRGADESNQSLEMFISEQRTGTENLLNDLRISYDNAETEAEKHERKMKEIRNNGKGINSNFGAEAAKRAEEEAKKHFQIMENSTEEGAESLDTALADLEHKYKIHKVSEADYWVERKRLLEQYRDDNSEEWHELYDKVTAHPTSQIIGAIANQCSFAGSSPAASRMVRLSYQDFAGKSCRQILIDISKSECGHWICNGSNALAFVPFNPSSEGFDIPEDNRSEISLSGVKTITGIVAEDEINGTIYTSGSGWRNSERLSGRYLSAERAGDIAAQILASGGQYEYNGWECGNAVVPMPYNIGDCIAYSGKVLPVLNISCGFTALGIVAQMSAPAPDNSFSEYEDLYIQKINGCAAYDRVLGCVSITRQGIMVGG